MKTALTIKNYRCFVQPATVELITGFTAFTGVNNAGKSTIMRFLLELRPFFEQIGTGHFENSLINDQSSFQPIHVFDNQEIFSNLNDEGIEFWFDFYYSQDEKTNKSPRRISFKVDRSFHYRTYIYFEENEPLLFRPGNTRLRPSIVQSTTPGNEFIVDLKELYRIGSVLKDTLYIGPFRNTINIGTNENYLDIQIGESFIKQFRSMKTGNNKRESSAITKLTDDIRDLFGFKNLDISPSSDDKSLHISINSKPFKQHELGSGLQQFVIVLANASIRRPSLILIDEPELNLHPSLQTDFMTALGVYAKEGVWFSTHSLGLARSSAESVYSVQSISDGDSIIRPLEGTPRLSEFLGEMSYSSHQTLGFEKLLLVEGPTEVKAFKQILRRLKKEHEIMLLPLNGRFNNDMSEELDELMRITTKISALIDSEKTSESDPINPQRLAFQDLCAERKIDCHILDRRAAENYFEDHTIKTVFGQEYRSLSEYEKLSEANPHWSKNLNWKLGQALDLPALLNTDLGKFLNQL